MKVKFGYNRVSEENYGYYSWSSMGTKTNPNIGGNLLGFYSAGDKTYMISQVTSSFCDDLTVGTIDAREIIFYHGTIISNNDNIDAMVISNYLSAGSIKKTLENSQQLEELDAFKHLKDNGIELQKVEVSPEMEEEIEKADKLLGSLTICGVEGNNFELLKQDLLNVKTR